MPPPKRIQNGSRLHAHKTNKEKPAGPVSYDVVLDSAPSPRYCVSVFELSETSLGGPNSRETGTYDRGMQLFRVAGEIEIVVGLERP